MYFFKSCILFLKGGEMQRDVFYMLVLSPKWLQQLELGLSKPGPWSFFWVLCRVWSCKEMGHPPLLSGALAGSSSQMGQQGLRLVSVWDASIVGRRFTAVPQCQPLENIFVSLRNNEDIVRVPLIYI